MRYCCFDVFTQSQTGSSLGGSLGSTGGSRGSQLQSPDLLANSHLRDVELGNIGISNEFLEEDDDEESKSDSVYVCIIIGVHMHS